MAVRLHGPVISATELGANSVGTSELVALAVTTAKIAADAIDGTKLADDAVDSEHLADGSIDPAHLAAAAVETAKLAASAVTGAKLATAFAQVHTFTGINGAGAVTLTGASVGDRVVALTGLTTPGDASADFEATITVDDQIQQSAVGDLSTSDYLVVLLPAAA